MPAVEQYSRLTKTIICLSPPNPPALCVGERDTGRTKLRYRQRSINIIMTADIHEDNHLITDDKINHDAVLHIDGNR